MTELDTQLLFDEGVTAKGKPLVHHLMNEDLKQAYELAKVESDSLVPITPTFLKRMNAMLMRTTGSVHSVMGGSFDSSKGEFRLCGVTAVSYTHLLEKWCKEEYGHTVDKSPIAKAMFYMYTRFEQLSGYVKMCIRDRVWTT